MSPLARSLLVLATAALLYTAVAYDPYHCTRLHSGSDVDHEIRVDTFHVNMTDHIYDFPPSKCDDGDEQVGQTVTACDNFGDRPKVQWLDDEKRVRVTCAWTAGTTCPDGLDICFHQNCRQTTE